MKQNQYNQRKYVYLFELDSVRKTDKEIIAGQKALYTEIVENGNIVVNILIAYMEEKIGTGDWKKINLFFQNCIALYIVELFTDKISRICPFIHPLSDSLRNGIRLVLDFFRSFFHHKKFYYNKCNQDVELEERQ